ncbi:hypothetical protein VTH06DRAFT_2062 [Thermothelomyces fergusii]
MAAAAPPQPAAPAPRAVPVQDLMVPCQKLWGGQSRPSRHDSSYCHPVFFTDRLRRPPFAIPPGLQSSPVAHGYVYRDAPRGSDKPAGPRL